MDLDIVCHGGRTWPPVLEGPLHVGFHVALSGAGRDRRGGDRAAARPRQHDARRLAQPFATAHAAACAAAIRRHHRDHGDDLGHGALGIQGAVLVVAGPDSLASAKQMIPRSCFYFFCRNGSHPVDVSLLRIFSGCAKSATAKAPEARYGVNGMVEELTIDQPPVHCRNVAAGQCDKT